ncbi:hypothetical protein Adt_11682 [Abeliophyllum distichum]|uniref:Uncharacterized protein n=1 Tax=Abeliophyllum distichum TaxID=126358 RepID=A0ABD1UPG1_9LAMI
MERLKVDRAEVEAKAVTAYQEGFGDTSEYHDLAHHFMTVGGEQLVESIGDVHPEWNLSFLRHPPGEASTFVEPSVSGEASTFVEPSVSGEAPIVSKALGTTPPNEVGPQCANPS